MPAQAHIVPSSSSVSKMASDKAKLLNATTKDREKLDQLLMDYFTNDGNDSDCLSDTAEGAELDSEDDSDRETPLEDDVTIARINTALEFEMNQTTHNNDDEYAKADAFRCSCRYEKDKPCYTRYTPEEMVRRRLDMYSLTPREQMLVLLGKISCSVSMGEKNGAQRRQNRKTD
ncbi:hypothetical protein ScPMuIL_005160 [Solemya velum]